MVRLLGLVACLAAAFVVFYLDARSPAPAPLNAPARAFSAARAIRDIKVIAAVPHPMGSTANAAVRDYLVARMAALGLSPQVQQARSVSAPPKTDIILGGRVQNVVGVLPGRDRDLPAVVLMAHYDSVPASPGAADDAAGVSSALEIARAIKVRGVPARDVMLVITDGEEAGMLGANAFFRDHPLAAHAGFVLNMEARGNGGRVSMFQTSPDNGNAVALYQRAAVGPRANSLAAFIYKVLPNDTDLTVSLAKGVPGMLFAFIGRQFDYHAPTATLANLDRGSIQSMGDQVLGTAAALAFSNALPAPSPDVVYGVLPFGVMASYPTAAGWLVLLAAASAAALGALGAWHAKAYSWRDLWKGVGASLLILIVAVIFLQTTRLTTGAHFGFLEQRPLLARFPLFELAMLASGLAAVLVAATALAAGRGRRAATAAVLAAALGLIALGGFQQPAIAPALVLGVVGATLAYLTLGRSACVAGVWTGMLLTGLGVALALQIAAPTAALVVAWPVAAASMLSALLAGGSTKNPAAWVVATILAALTLSWVGGTMHAFMEALDQPVLPAVIVWVGAMVLLPLAWPRPPQSAWNYAPGVVALTVGLGLAIYLSSTNPWTSRYPDTVMPLYVVDHDAGRSWRVSVPAPNAWARAVLTADGGAVGKRSFPGFRRALDAAPARSVAAAAPAISLTQGPDGTVTLTAPFTPQTLGLVLELKSDTRVSDTRVNGRPMKLLASPGEITRLSWEPDPEGVTVSFKPVGPGSLDIGYAAYLDGWPKDARPLPPMPPAVMGFDLSGSTVVTGRLRQSWTK